MTSELPPAVAGPSKYSTAARPRLAAALVVALPLAARFADGRLFTALDFVFTPCARFFVAISMYSVNRLVWIAVAPLDVSGTFHQGPEIVQRDSPVDLHKCSFYDVLQLGRIQGARAAQRQQMSPRVRSKASPLVGSKNPKTHRKLLPRFVLQYRRPRPSDDRQTANVHKARRGGHPMPVHRSSPHGIRPHCSNPALRTDDQPCCRGNVESPGKGGKFCH